MDGILPVVGEEGEVVEVHPVIGIEVAEDSRGPKFGMRLFGKIEHGVRILPLVLIVAVEVGVDTHDEPVA